MPPTQTPSTMIGSRLHGVMPACRARIAAALALFPDAARAARLGAVVPLATAMRALAGDAPSMRTRCSRCPPSSRMAMQTFQLFFLASASAAAEILRQSSRVSIGRVFMGAGPV